MINLNRLLSEIGVKGYRYVDGHLNTNSNLMTYFISTGYNGRGNAIDLTIRDNSVDITIFDRDVTGHTDYKHLNDDEVFSLIKTLPQQELPKLQLIKIQH
jgi:hypothetical protein